MGIVEVEVDLGVPFNSILTFSNKFRDALVYRFIGPPLFGGEWLAYFCDDI